MSWRGPPAAGVRDVSGRPHEPGAPDGPVTGRRGESPRRVERRFMRSRVPGGARNRVLRPRRSPPQGFRRAFLGRCRCPPVMHRFSTRRHVVVHRHLWTKRSETRRRESPGTVRTDLCEAAGVAPEEQTSEIEPDDKDWTWVLQRRCEQCGLEAGRVAAGAARRALLPRLRGVGADPGREPGGRGPDGLPPLVGARVRRPRPRRARAHRRTARPAAHPGGPGLRELGPGRGRAGGPLRRAGPRARSRRTSRRPGSGW